MPTADPSDETRHAPADGIWWNESWYFDFAKSDGTIGGYVRIGLYPNQNVTWYWACLVEEGSPLVTVIDHEVPLPAREGSLEVRHDGLWADHNVEEPLGHMSLSLESFALVLEDAADIYHDPRGERVPFGFQLDWHTDRNAFMWPPVTSRYEIPCTVEGELQVGDRRIAFEGPGQRDHSWGDRDWWTMPWCWNAGALADGTRWHSAGGFVPGTDFGVGYVLPAGSSEFVDVTQVVVETTLGREGFPDAAHLGVGDLQLDVAPVAFSPVFFVDPDGRESRFPRAMSRFTASDGRTGVGWIEWNQPS